MYYTEFEICRDYRLAADGTEQIRVLAQLNATTQSKIREILSNNGYEVKKPIPRMKWTDEINRILVEMRQRGLKTKEIAEMMGLSSGTISMQISNLKRRGKLDAILQVSEL